MTAAKPAAATAAPKVAPSLTQIQEETLQRMQEQRTSERRTDKARSAAVRQYRKQAKKLGYTVEQVAMQVCDIWDMYRLRTDANAEHRGWL